MSKTNPTDCPTCGGRNNYSNGEDGTCSNSWHFYTWGSDQVQRQAVANPDLNTQIEQIVEKAWNDGAQMAGGLYLEEDKDNLTVPAATAQLQQLVQKEMVKELRRVYYDQVQGDVMYDNSPYATDDEFDPFLEERIKELEQKGGVS